MSKIYAGVDIGSNGGVCVINGDTLTYCKTPKIANEIDAYQLATFIISASNGNDNIHIVIEDLHSIFGTSAKSNFAFGVNNGIVIGMLQSLQLPYTKVSPKAWQKQIWQGIRPVQISTGKKNKDGLPKYKTDTKATSLLAAKRLFPKESFLATERSKVPHDGIVDSVLLAEYARRNF